MCAHKMWLRDGDEPRCLMILTARVHVENAV